MSARIATRITVNALVRRVGADGGNATVIARGDDTAGAILLILADRGVVVGLRERVLGADGRYRWVPTGPRESADPPALAEFLDRRRRADPDLWMVELDIPDAERFADEMVFGD